MANIRIPNTAGMTMRRTRSLNWQMCDIARNCTSVKGLGVQEARRVRRSVREERLQVT
jgi:hypothetical protein